METPPARVGKVNSSTLCAEQPRESQDRPTERRGYTEPLRNLDDRTQLGRNLELPPGLDVREHRRSKVSEPSRNVDAFVRCHGHFQLQNPPALLHLLHHSYAQCAH